MAEKNPKDKVSYKPKKETFQLEGVTNIVKHFRINM